MTVGVIGTWKHLKPQEWMRSHRSEGRVKQRNGPGLALRYTRTLQDLVGDVELTNEPEEVWLKAVNFLGKENHISRSQITQSWPRTPSRNPQLAPK